MALKAMYLGIDFLITPRSELYVLEVNIGLPGGAEEYHLSQLVHGKFSDIFFRIEALSEKVYGKNFHDYIHSLPFIEPLKKLKIWMDGMGPLPEKFHPGLRLEDKWIQYQLLSPIFPLPETILYHPDDPLPPRFLLHSKGRIVLKRRVGRGGKGFIVMQEPEELGRTSLPPNLYIAQEFVESRIEGFNLSIRSVAFAGEFICMYANLSRKITSNHGILVAVEPGNCLVLGKSEFSTRSFNQRSWEAKIWFGQYDPPYLRHNLYEDEVALTTLSIPASVFDRIVDLSLKIERFYEGIDLAKLPAACFEE